MDGEGVVVITRAVARAKVRHVTSRSFAQRDRASGYQKLRRVFRRSLNPFPYPENGVGPVRRRRDRRGAVDRAPVGPW